MRFFDVYSPGDARHKVTKLNRPLTIDMLKIAISIADYCIDKPLPIDAIHIDQESYVWNPDEVDYRPAFTLEFEFKTKSLHVRIVSFEEGKTLSVHFYCTNCTVDDVFYENKSPHLVCRKDQILTWLSLWDRDHKCKC